MSEPAFKIGDVVQLKSGGPRMAVCRADQAGINIILCQWIHEACLAEAPFHPDMLNKLDTPAQKPAEPRGMKHSCSHPLRRHDATGVCLERMPNGAPCPCRLEE